MNDWSNDAPTALTPESFQRLWERVREEAGKPLRLQANEHVEVRGRAFAEWWLTHQEAQAAMSPEQMAAKLEGFGLRPAATAFCVGHVEFCWPCASCIVAAAMRQASTAQTVGVDRASGPDRVGVALVTWGTVGEIDHVIDGPVLDWERAFQDATKQYAERPDEIEVMLLGQVHAKDNGPWLVRADGSHRRPEVPA